MVLVLTSKRQMALRFCWNPTASFTMVFGSWNHRSLIKQKLLHLQRCLLWFDSEISRPRCVLLRWHYQTGKKLLLCRVQTAHMVLQTISTASSKMTDNMVWCVNQVQLADDGRTNDFTQGRQEISPNWLLMSLEHLSCVMEIVWLCWRANCHQVPLWLTGVINGARHTRWRKTGIFLPSR